MTSPDFERAFADLVDLVRRMRAAQRAYFARRLNADLQLAQRLEREVDAALEPKDRGLFDGGDAR